MLEGSLYLLHRLWWTYLRVEGDRDARAAEHVRRVHDLSRELLDRREQLFLRSALRHRLRSRVGRPACYWNRYGTQCNHPARGQSLFEPGGSAWRYWNG